MATLSSIGALLYTSTLNSYSCTSISRNGSKHEQNGRPHCTAPLFISYALDLFFLPSLGNKALYTICFSLVFHGTNYVCFVTDGVPSKLLGWYRNSLEAPRLLSASLGVYSIALGLLSTLFGCYPYSLDCFRYPSESIRLLSVFPRGYSITFGISWCPLPSY